MPTGWMLKPQMPRGGNLANCYNNLRPYLMVFHGRYTSVPRDHTPPVQPRRTHHGRRTTLPGSATHGSEPRVTRITYPCYVLRVLPRDRNKPALFLRVIENFRQTRTASLALLYDVASSRRLRSAHRNLCSTPSLHDGVGFDMKIRLSSAGENVFGMSPFFSSFFSLRRK